MPDLLALREALRLAPDPADARRRLDRLVECGLAAHLPALRRAGDDALAVLRIACAQAPYLATLAARDLGRLVAAATDPHLRREKPRAVMAAELDRTLAGFPPDEAGLCAGLRAYRAREMIRLGARECGLGPADEVGRELSALADVAFDAALAFHDAELARQLGEPFYLGDDGAYHRAHLGVMGMGKLGGRELNFASDVDVIYFYPSDEGQAGERTLHEYFQQLARRVTRALAEITEDDLVFRVDLRLRPEGSRGPLVNALPSAERYYEAWGRPWERQAWLKARPCAGDLELGRLVLATLEPFVYPRHTSPAVIREVHDLNRKIKAELDTTRLGGGFDVKVGVGGIREVEFFVQALQLIHAGKQPQLREASTRRALDRLLLAGLVAERERAQLADAYDFLRQVEHLLQLEDGQQTQRLPADAARIGVLARRLGLADAGELSGRLALHTEAVARLFGELSTEPPMAPDIAVLLDPERPAAEAMAALGRLGFGDPEAALQTLESLRRRPLSPLGPAASPAVARLAPALLKELSASPDPDQALAYLADLAGRGAHAEYVWALLVDRPALLRLLCSLFGTSAFLARGFVLYPERLQDLGATLADNGALADLGRLADAGGDGAGAGLDPDDDEAVFNALRRAKSEALLRIGLKDIAGGLDVGVVGEQLSELADACVRRTFDQVGRQLTRRAGAPPLPRMAVLALGKLGGRELGYGSDLDLIFIHEGELEEHERATRWAQRLVGALSAQLDAGRLYEVDTRLRPSGNQGTLVVSLAGFRAYHAESSQLWERQALIKLRAVAGDAELGAAVERERLRAVWGRPPTDPAALAGEIAAMRARIEKELGPQAEGVYDVKTGPGGLVDVEFTAQALQLVHGHAEPRLRVRGTLAALDAAAAAGLLGPEDRDVLAGGWRFLRRIEHRLRIVQDRATSVLPAGAELTKLARRMGLGSAGSLERQVVVWTRDVRACYLKIFAQLASTP